MIPDHYTLAGSDVVVSALGVGTWAWGDRSTWGMGGYDTDLTKDTIREAWEATVDGGVTLFDTAEVYGGGESERIIGSLLDSDPDRAGKVVVATEEAELGRLAEINRRAVANQVPGVRMLDAAELGLAIRDTEDWREAVARLDAAIQARASIHAAGAIKVFADIYSDDAPRALLELFRS